ncbi:MAG: hypothetical protein ACREYA_10465 [Cupriavidus necator]
MQNKKNAPPSRPRSLALAISPALFIATLAKPVSALADCTNNTPTSGMTVTCSGTLAPRVNAVVGSTGVTIDVASGSTQSLTRAVGAPDAAISVDASSQITHNGTLTLTGGGGTGTNRAAGLLGTGNGNTITNGSQGTITTTGAFNDGIAANGSDNRLTNQGTISTAGPNSYGMSAAWGQTNVGQSGNTLTNTGSITTTGSNARGMSILGGSGTVVNQGTVLVTGQNSPGVYMQGNNNRLVNSGLIEARGGNSVPPLSPNGVFSNTASAGFTATIENLPGGQIISRQGFAVRTLNGASTLINAGLLQSDVGQAVDMGTGANTLILQIGSVIRGSASGGGNPATRLVLQGSGTADNAFLNFPTLIMEGADWTWAGSGTFNTATLQSGRFNLTGTLGGATTVQPGATLAGTGVLTGSLLNQGTVHPGTGAASGQLTVNGSYMGANGVLRTESVLGADGSPAGRLVVSGGAIGGTTTIALTNLAGSGGVTVADLQRGVPQCQRLAGPGRGAGGDTTAAQRRDLVALPARQCAEELRRHRPDRLCRHRRDRHRGCQHRRATGAGRGRAHEPQPQPARDRRLHHQPRHRHAQQPVRLFRRALELVAAQGRSGIAPGAPKPFSQAARGPARAGMTVGQETLPGQHYPPAHPQSPPPRAVIICLLRRNDAAAGRRARPLRGQLHALSAIQ